MVGDNRAIGLADQFRSMGVTPAVASGWRQQAHDLADALMTSMNDPRAKDAAVALARAGFSPTPADLRFTPASTSTTTPQAAPAAAASPPVAVPAMAPDIVSAATTGALADAIGRIQLTAPPQAQTSAEQPVEKAADMQICGTSPDTSGTTDQPKPDQDDQPQSPSTPAGEHQAPPGLPNPGPSSDRAAGSEPETSGTSDTGSSGADGASAGSSEAAAWERQASDLAGKLATTDDPEAQQLADTLATVGITNPSTGSSGSPLSRPTTAPTNHTDHEHTNTAQDAEEADSSVKNNNINEDRQVRNNTGAQPNDNTSTDEESNSSSGESASDGLRASRSNSGSGSSSSTGDGQDGDSQDAGWQQRARELADRLAAADDDPTARELADKLTAAGITVDHPESGGESGDSQRGQQDRRDEHSTGGDSGEEQTTGDEDSSARDDGDLSGSGSAQSSGDGGGGSAEGPPLVAESAPTERPAPGPGSAGDGDDAVWDKLAQCSVDRTNSLMSGVSRLLEMVLGVRLRIPEQGSADASSRAGDGAGCRCDSAAEVGSGGCR
ncbi:hypothetical protein [Pseudonocardia dioxanivorans]|uniref:hypothetical protein n=1 Tax=Pseudonocardia dioxanivorans TaxID=240495 RepID=UPI00117E3003|nr:hypothetical protein [Pseudonocardia dioxanivorans]